ncbi:MAG: hypothetical protein SWH78_12175 [Thermodesulfobacteriota bacterium]|nr:hypothetical protein [Thermodesulfobacteriota bacterium]
MEQSSVRIERDLENMLSSLELLDDQMRNYTLNPKEYPKPDYERYNSLVLAYETAHRDGWNGNLRFRYERLLEKRACYEDTWLRWFDDAGLQYWKPGKKL